jgi:hypothetical protein
LRFNHEEFCDELYVHRKTPRLLSSQTSSAEGSGQVRGSEHFIFGPWRSGLPVAAGGPARLGSAYKRRPARKRTRIWQGLPSEAPAAASQDHNPRRRQIGEGTLLPRADQAKPSPLYKQPRWHLVRGCCALRPSERSNSRARSSVVRQTAKPIRLRWVGRPSVGMVVETLRAAFRLAAIPHANVYGVDRRLALSKRMAAEKCA